MNQLLSTEKLMPLLTGLISAIVGALVLWGWHNDNATLIQIRPDLAGMQYNSALCFLVSGLALLAIYKNYRLLPFLLGIFVLLISGLTLAEYIFNINVGIDRLFFKSSFPVQGSAPNRMSPNGAATLSLIGVSLALLSNYIKHKIVRNYFVYIVSIMCLVSLTISLVAIFGYMADVPETYGWRGYAQMAFHTACANILLSIGIVAMAKIKAKEHHLSFSSCFPFFIFIAIAVMTLLFWDASWSYVKKNQRNQNEIAATSIKETVNKDLKSRKEVLLGMVSRWKMRPGGTPYKEWYKDALNLISDEPGYQAIEWVDPHYRIQWVAPQKGNEIALNLNVAKGEKTLPALQLAIAKNMVTMTPIFTLKTGNKGFLFYAPIMDEKKFHGMIVGVLDAQSFFDEVFIDEIPDYNITVYAGNHVVYQRNPHQGIPPGHSVTVPLENLGWSITSWQKPELLAKHRPWLPSIILCIGFLAALLFSLIAYLAQIAKNNATNARKEIDRRKKTERQLIVYSEKLKKLSLLDALTGTNNRRSLTNILKESITQLHTEGTSFSVLLLDIDHFKKINDTYGHVVGDHVLQKIGSALREKMRSVDTIARYGGEEFCIVLPNTLAHHAREIAERLRHLVSEMIFDCEKGSFQITCSIGVCQAHSAVKKVNEIFEMADAALYKAKNSGRNCVVMEPFET